MQAKNSQNHTVQLENAGLDKVFSVLCLLVITWIGFIVIQYASKPIPAITRQYSNWAQDVPGYKQVMAEQKITHSPVLVYFYADWCPHCKELNSKVIRTRKVDQYLHRLPHVRIAPDHGTAEKLLMDRYNVEGYPTLFVVEENGSKKQVETHDMSTNIPRLKSPTEFVETLASLLKS